jgi:P27 family predicted phage terminase small subunit
VDAAVGSRGPAKKGHLHAVKGAADKRERDNFTPEAPPAYDPAEPDWKRLVGGRDKRLIEDAHDEWELTVKELERRGMLTRTDATSVVDYCICHARVLQCERRLSNKGFVVQGANGPVKNPVAQLLNQWRGSLQKHRDSLGLSPMARLRLGREEEVPPDDDSDLNEPPPV